MVVWGEEAAGDGELVNGEWSMVNEKTGKVQ
jgi:hypothetical protein